MTLPAIDFSQYTREEVEQSIREMDGMIARAEYSMESFKAFFRIIYPGKELLAHWEEPMAEVMNFEDMVIEAFRGSAKTTTFTNALAAFNIGHFPSRSGLLVQVGDDIASDNSSIVADIIEHNPGWKMSFPHIEPDKTVGWGAAGYEVMRTDMDYKEWRQLCLNDKGKDPTFLAVGYKSRAIIGKRPYWLMMDDIHDENNTASERELRKVKQIITGTIMPAANRAKQRFYIGTPWNEADALHYLLQTGEFKHVKVPVYKKDGTPTWPEGMGEEKIQKERRLAGEIEFARMYLLDLSKTKGLTLKKEWLRYWPHKEINQDWPVIMGVDFTSTEDPRKEKGDYFAQAHLRVIPGGKGVVIEGGVRERLSQAEAEGTVAAWANTFPTLLIIGVESIITGQIFYNNLLANAELRATGAIVEPVRFNKSKGYRFEKEMAPLFQKGRVYISDAEDPFLTQFVDEWMNWQGDALEAVYNNDCLDAVYAALKVGEAWVSPMVTQNRKITNPYFKTSRGANPFAALGRK